MDLFNICSLDQPDFIFISEPWLFQSDLALATSIFNPEYCSSLNSDDKFDQDLALSSCKAHGGTLVLWKRFLDPFVTIINVTTSRFLILLLNIPGSPVTIHVSVYLPTSGLDSDFVHELSNLEVILEELFESHPAAVFFIL